MAQQQKPGGGQAQGKKDGKKDGEDLTTILDPGQRADLTLLVANVTEAMRSLILENFSASAGLNKFLLKEDMTEDEKIMNASVDPGTADVEAFDRERKLKEQYLKELATPKMKMLKSDTLKYYDSWREEVIQRIGEVVNSKKEARKQLQQDVKPQSSRPKAPASQPLKDVAKKSASQGPIKFKDLYPPTKTPLTKLSISERTLVLHAVFLLLLSLEHYNAHSRVMLLNMASSLKLSLRVFENDEAVVAKGLLEAAKAMSADEETKKKAEQNRDSRKWKVGLATVAGAAIVGVTGGLAAPLVAAGVGSVMGGLGLGATAAAGYLGSVAGSTMLVGSLFGAYGGRMTGQMMDNYAREVEDFAFLPVHSSGKTSEDQKEGAKQASSHEHKLRVTICISGWLTEKDEVVTPWKVMGKGAEVFGLRWELESLLNLGNAMQGMVTSAAWGYAQKELISRTIFADLMGAMWPLGLLKVSRLIDNPFSVARGRAEKTGEVLADALINKAQGERPVTLIGYSLGARVIYTCLRSLARRRAFGLIENVVLMGAPTPSDASDWRILRTAVSGRLVNVYSQDDYVLGFMYRTSSVQYGVAGLQKIEGVAGVENVDVSEDVKGHLRYRFLVGSILKRIGFEDVDMDAVQEEQEILKKKEEEEEKQSLRAQKDRLMRRNSKGGKVDEDAEAEEELAEMQKTVAAKTEKSLMTRAIEYFYLPGTPSAKDVEQAAGTATQVAQDPKEATKVAGEAAGDVNKKATAATQGYTQWAASHLPNMPYRGKSSAPTDATKSVPGADAAGTAPKVGGVAAPDAKKSASTAAPAKTGSLPAGQSYTQRAAGYVPKSIPSLPKFGFGSSTQAPRSPAPKLERKGSGVPGLSKTASGNQVPKLDRKPSGVQTPQGTRAPAPKLDRLPSGAKSPPAVQRTASGMKSPPASGAPGVKSPGSMSRTTSEVNKPPLAKRTSSAMKPAIAAK